MIDYYNQNIEQDLCIVPGEKGFYAPETLKIAVMAAESSNDLKEVFYKSQVPEGDNDSTAALAFALWYLKTGEDLDERIFNRFQKMDRDSLEGFGQSATDYFDARLGNSP